VAVISAFTLKELPKRQNSPDYFFDPFFFRFAAHEATEEGREDAPSARKVRRERLKDWLEVVEDWFELLEEWRA